MSDVREKLAAGVEIFLERAPDGAGDHARVGFFHPADGHAQVQRLHDHAHAAGMQRILQKVRDFLGHAFL